MYLFYTILFCAGLAIYALDGHTIAKEVVITKYRRFRDLNKLVQTRYQTIGMILWVSLNMIAKMYWLNFLHWANNSIEHIDHKTVIVSYVINGKLYRMVERTKRGPTNVLLVIDQDSNDVSDTILPFMGPNQDWHGREFIPSFWGKQSLTFELASGEQKTFSANEIIKLEN